jgi:hypothetical protein
MLWHSTLPRMGIGFLDTTSFPCYQAVYDGIIYAIAIWSNPVSRSLPQHEWMELRRFAIAPDAPKNTASRMLSIMVRLIGKRFLSVVKLISYHDIENHKGTIYKACGWTPTIINKDGEWNRPSRKRPVAQRPGPKQRWEKDMGRA